VKRVGDRATGDAVRRSRRSVAMLAGLFGVVVMTTRRIGAITATLVFAAAIAGKAEARPLGTSATTLVTVSIDFKGTVTSSDGGISCTGTGWGEWSGDCDGFSENGDDVTLTATPAAHYVFAQWAEPEGCAGAATNPTCQLAIQDGDPDIALHAIFQPIQHTATVTVDEGAADRGLVRIFAPSVPADPGPPPDDHPMNECDTDCSVSVYEEDTPTFRAYPEVGSSFLGWTQDCSGKRLACTRAMTDALEVTARFRPTKIAVSDASLREPDGVTKAVKFVVTLPGRHGGTVTVAFRTVAGTAKPGSDFVARSGTLTFAPGESRKTVAVRIKGDRRDEPNETFKLRLSGPSNATLRDAVGRGVIRDND
jgi:hypothetical protein